MTSRDTDHRFIEMDDRYSRHNDGHREREYNRSGRLSRRVRDRDRDRNWGRDDRGHRDHEGIERDRNPRRDRDREEWDIDLPSYRRRQDRSNDLGRDRGFGFSFGGGNAYEARYRSPSPPPNTVPLNERPRKITKFDTPPPGYEAVSAEQAKATGQFLLPCHKAVAKMAPGHMVPPGGSGYKFGRESFSNVSTYSSIGLNPQQARQQKRLYIGSLPNDIGDVELVAFVNEELNRHNMTPNAVSASFGGDRSFAFVEFVDSEAATAALCLDGANFMGYPLKFKRPKEYVPPTGEDGMALPFNDAGLNGGDASPDKLFVGGLPHDLTEEQVKEVLKSFGELKNLSLIMDSERGLSKGYAFCEYVSTEAADLAIAGLNNMEIGDRKLVVQRSSTASRMGLGPALGLVATMTAAGGIGSPSRVLLLLNLIAIEDVREASDVDEFLADVREHCSKYGTVECVQFPQFPETTEMPTFVQIFVVYKNQSDCRDALRHVAGRTYNGRTVIGGFYPEDRWAKEDFYGSRIAKLISA